MPKILIVPQKLEIEFGTSFLDRRSFTVRSAADGPAALQTALTWRPELILVGSELGSDMSAPELCEAIRNSSLLHSTKILMLTVALSSHASQQSSSEQADAHLIDPINESQLLETIRSLLKVSERRAPRARVEILARVEECAASEGKAPAAMASILSLSEHGVLLESEHMLTIGSENRLMFFLPGADTAVHVTGFVLYADEMLLRYAIEFRGVADSDRERIRGFVVEHLPRALNSHEQVGEGTAT